MKLAWQTAVLALVLLAAVLVLAVAVPGCDRRNADADPAGSPPVATATEPVVPDPTAPERPPREPGRYDEAILHEGRTRTHVLVVPEVYDGLEPLPLVLALHAGRGDAEQMIAVSGIVEAAERHGFLVAFPEGTAGPGDPLLSWNAGNCCGFAMERDIDDAGYLRALVDHLSQDLAVDLQRIYATGIANGAMMVYRLACEMGDLLAAIAPVSGALNFEECAPGAPISVIAFHGTEDSYVAYDGGEPVVILDGDSRIDASVAESTGFFIEHNGCHAEPDRSTAGLVHKERYGPCIAGTEVVVVTIEGGGHAWPGGDRAGSLTDVPTRWPDATEQIWEFFATHQRPQ